MGRKNVLLIEDFLVAEMKNTSAFAEKPITELATEEDGTGRIKIRKVELVVEWVWADLDGWFGLMLNGCKKASLIRETSKRLVRRAVIRIR